MTVLSAIRERLAATLRHRSTRPTPAMRTSFPERRRRLPSDPAIWVWLAVALMALVPLAEHAIAARLDDPTHAAKAARAPGAEDAPRATAPQAPSGSGTATS
jgi:hypothetical protein